MGFKQLLLEHQRRAEPGQELTEKSKIMALTRICPAEFTNKMILDGITCTSLAELEGRLLAYRTAHQQIALLQGRAQPMDLSAMGTTTAKPVGDPEELKEHEARELEARLDAKIAALVQGKGGKGAGPWAAYQGQAQAQKGKSKGKGKGGKPSAAQVGWRRQASKPMAQVMCPELVRTGKCTYQERTGTRCKFAHSSNMPKALSALEGVISTDLPLTYDQGSGCFTCGEVSSEAIDAIQAGIESAYKELVAEFEEAGNKCEEGFQWPP